MKTLFNNWLYERTADNSSRFVLGESGNSPLICIGINPSTATPEKLDPTLRKVREFSKRRGYDGWIMLNLYPQRATNPNDLHKEPNEHLIQLNTEHINEVIGSLSWNDRRPFIWCAWGNLIEKRPWLKDGLQRMYEALCPYNPVWYNLGKLTKPGHPRHPLYLPYHAESMPFDIKSYLENTL